MLQRKPVRLATAVGNSRLQVPLTTASRVFAVLDQFSNESSLSNRCLFRTDRSLFFEAPRCEIQTEPAIAVDFECTFGQKLEGIESAAGQRRNEEETL